MARVIQTFFGRWPDRARIPYKCRCGAGLTAPKYKEGKMAFVKYMNQCACGVVAVFKEQEKESA